MVGQNSREDDNDKEIIRIKKRNSEYNKAITNFI